MNPPVVFLNGSFLPENQASIPISDRGFLYGDGVFTTIKVIQGKPEHLNLHLIKLFGDCEKVGIIPPKIAEKDVSELIRLNLAKEGVWRLKIVITGGNKPDLNLGQRAAGQCLITIKPYTGHASTCRLISYPFPISYPMGSFKSLSYLDRLWVKDYALKNDVDDVLLYDPAGRILESSFANIFWKIGNELFFPDPSLPFYQGVTIQIILDSCQSLSMNTVPSLAKLDEIPEKAQFYLCNSLRGVIPVVAIDDKNYIRDLSFEEIIGCNKSVS